MIKRFLAWFFLGDIKSKWQHGVMCTMWAITLCFWMYFPPKKHNEDTRVDCTAFAAAALGFQLSKFLEEEPK